jgi:hypothetical protein
MSKAVKIIFKAMVKPVVYGSEMWPMSDMDIKRLNTRKRKILRRMHGPVVEQVIWRIRTNWDQKLCKDLDVVADIKKKRPEWIGQLARMDLGRVVTNIFAFKLQVRRMARPRLRLLEDVERIHERWRLKDGDRRH